METADDGLQALNLFSSHSFHLVITDLVMPGMNGLELMREIRQLDPDIQFIVLSGLGGVQEAVSSLREAGAFHYLTKPLSGQTELLNVVESALEKQRLQAENRELSANLERRVEERTAELKKTNEQLVNEIKKRAQIERRLYEAERRYRTVFDEAPDALFLTDPVTLSILHLNPTAVQLLESSYDDIVGLHQSEIHPEDERERIQREFLDPLRVQNRTGRVARMETLVLRPDGRQVPVEISARSMDMGGKTTFFFVYRDISERKRAEEALRRSEEKYRSLFEYGAVGIFQTTLQGKFLNVNPAFATMLGYSGPEEVISEIKDIAQQVYDDPEQRREMILRISEKKGVHSAEVELLRKNGEVWSALLQLRFVRDSEGKSTILEGFAEDITARKESEKALRESEERFRQLAENIEQVFWLTSLKNNRTIYVSPAYERIWGRSVDSLYANPASWLDAVVPEDRERVRESAVNLQVEGRYDETYRIRRPDGTIRWIQDRAFPVLGESGQPYRVAGITEDVTLKKEAEESLIRAKDAAESSNRAKNEFLANISHEFRTPMNHVMGVIDLILEARLTPDQRELLQLAQDSAHSLLDMINDLIELSHLEAGKIGVQLQPFDVHSVLAGLAHRVDHEARLKGISINTSVSPDIPPILLGDLKKLSVLIEKLLYNAVKFTEKGSVDISVSCTSRDENKVRLHFQIRDSGVGISRENLKLIFGGLTQGDGSSTRKFGGLGLGLSIALRLTQLLGGKMWADSEPGKGSNFHVELDFVGCDADDSSCFD